MTKLSSSPVMATIAVQDLAAAKEFYVSTLGFEVMYEQPSVLGLKSGGTDFMVYESSTGGTNQASSATWAVEDIESTLDELRGLGVTFEHYDGMPVEWQGDIAVMGDMKTAWFKDPSGNILAVTLAL